MAKEVMLKTHLIVTDTHEEYSVKWFGKLKDVNPELHNGLPTFVIVTSLGRTEINTIDLMEIERVSKKMTRPRGKQSLTTDTARIYIREVDGTEKPIGAVVHDHVKTYAQMYDRVGIK